MELGVKLEKSRIYRYLIIVLEFVGVAESISMIVERAWIPSLWSMFVAALLIYLLYKRIRKEHVLSFAPFLGLFFLLLLPISINWVLGVFPLWDSYLVITTLNSPLEGFSLIYVRKYLLEICLPLILITLGWTPIVGLITGHVKGKILIPILISLSMGWAVFQVYTRIPVEEYLEYFTEDIDSEGIHSDLYRDYYVSMDTNSVEAPAQTKNLILIVMESMETTFADSAFQGENLIRELTIARPNEYNFSVDAGFGGGFDVRGSRNTISAIISKTTGCPQLFDKSIANVTLSKVPSIYDILHSFNYYNVFVQGTDGDFEGHRLFTETHGIDVLYDMEALKEHQDLDERYRHFEYELMNTFDAGLTDHSIFEISKMILDTLSQKDHFTLSISTIETHFPYGFYNEMCEDKPENSSEESLFRATIRCASKDTRAFIEWVKKQTFYDDTEIVIVGDHLFMGRYLVDKDDMERNWIDLFINPSITPTREKNRRFTSFDIAPSILEGMGFSIQNHRMGFGVSLFSDEKTIMEKIGYESLSAKLKWFEKSLEYKALNE